jgi:hypothetical protein
MDITDISIIIWLTVALFMIIITLLFSSTGSSGVEPAARPPTSLTTDEMDTEEKLQHPPPAFGDHNNSYSIEISGDTPPPPFCEITINPNPAVVLH